MKKHFNVKQSAAVVPTQCALSVHDGMTIIHFKMEIQRKENSKKRRKDRKGIQKRDTKPWNVTVHNNHRHLEKFDSSIARLCTYRVECFSNIEKLKNFCISQVGTLLIILCMFFLKLLAKQNQKEESISSIGFLADN